MSKQPKEKIARYTKAERLAEAEIDQFLHSVNPSSPHVILEQLRELAG